MYASLKKNLLKLLGLELLGKEMGKALHRLRQHLAARLQQRLAAWGRVAGTWWLLLHLVRWALFFGLVALALYCNVLLQSAHLGFAMVAGLCTLGAGLLWWRLARRRPKA